MKKMFVAFGIAIVVICGIFAVTSVNAQATEDQITKEDIEESITELAAEQYPDHTIDNVSVITVDEDASYGGYEVGFTCDVDGRGLFGVAGMNSLDF